MDAELVFIVQHDIKSRSFRCEILKGEKRLPVKYIIPYRSKLRIVDAYKDYLYAWECRKYISSVQMTLEDFLND